MEPCGLCGQKILYPELPETNYKGKKVHPMCKSLKQNWPQEDVEEFHRKFGVVINTTPQMPDQTTQLLRRSLIFEEASELIIALQGLDLEEIADGIADVMYVILGTAVSYGIDMQPIWNEVQRTNMLKEGGQMRQDGKIMKPEGWQPPQIKELLIAQGAEL